MWQLLDVKLFDAQATKFDIANCPVLHAVHAESSDVVDVPGMRRLEWQLLLEKFLLLHWPVVLLSEKVDPLQATQPLPPAFTPSPTPHDWLTHGATVATVLKL